MYPLASSSFVRERARLFELPHDFLQRVTLPLATLASQDQPTNVIVPAGEFRRVKIMSVTKLCSSVKYEVIFGLQASDYLMVYRPPRGVYL